VLPTTPIRCRFDFDDTPENWRAEVNDLEKRGFSIRAERWRRNALETEEEPDPDSVRVSRACSALGMNLYRAGKVDEVNKYFKRSVTVFNKIVYKKDSDRLSRDAVYVILSSRNQLRPVEELNRNPDVQFCTNFHCPNDVNIVNMILSDNYESFSCSRCQVDTVLEVLSTDFDGALALLSVLLPYHKPFCAVAKLPGVS